MDTSSLLEGLNPSIDDDAEHDTFEDSLENNFISSLRPQNVSMQPEVVAANSECQLNVIPPSDDKHEESTQMLTQTNLSPTTMLPPCQPSDLPEEFT